MEEKTIVVIDQEGKEQTMDILFTFEDDQFNKNYVLYVDPQDETGEVFVSSYTTEGALEAITDEKEWAMIEEVFNAFIIQHEGEEGEGHEGHNHTHGDGCACGHDHSHE